MDQSSKANSSVPAKSVKAFICYLSAGPHNLESCNEFIGKTLSERATIVKEFRCFLKCLSKCHVSKACWITKKCGIEDVVATIVHSCMTRQGCTRSHQKPQTPNKRRRQPTQRTLPPVLHPAMVHNAIQYSTQQQINRPYCLLLCPLVMGKFISNIDK